MSNFNKWKTVSLIIKWSDGLFYSTEQIINWDIKEASRLFASHKYRSQTVSLERNENEG